MERSRGRRWQRQRKQSQSRAWRWRSLSACVAACARSGAASIRGREAALSHIAICHSKHFQDKRDRQSTNSRDELLSLHICWGGGGQGLYYTQSSPALHNPMYCGPPGSSVHGIFLARILQWEATPFSGGPFRPRDQIRVSCTAGRFFTIFPKW